MDQRVENPISQADIKEVFLIAEEMTSIKRPLQPKSPTELRLEALGDFAIAHATAGFLILIGLAALTYFIQTDSLKVTGMSIGILTILCVLVFFILLILSGISLIMTMRKAPYSFFLKSVETSLAFDFPFVNRLALFDVRAVQFVLSVYKNEREGLEKRGGALSGSIERVGIFPALGAVAVLSLALSKIDFGNGLIQMLPPLIVAFQILNLGAFGMLQKMDRVINVFDYSVKSRS